MTDRQFVDQIDEALAEDPMRRIYVIVDGLYGWIESVRVEGEEILVEIGLPR